MNEAGFSQKWNRNNLPVLCCELNEQKHLKLLRVTEIQEVESSKLAIITILKTDLLPFLQIGTGLEDRAPNAWVL